MSAPKRLRPVAIATALLASLLATGCDGAPPERGIYYWGAEVNAVCPCGSRQCYWVKTGPDIGNRLKGFVQRNTSKPYQGVYLVYRGQLLDEATVGFAANYDGLMAVDEVLGLTVEIPSDCPPP